MVPTHSKNLKDIYLLAEPTKERVASWLSGNIVKLMSPTRHPRSTWWQEGAGEIEQMNE